MVKKPFWKPGFFFISSSFNGVFHNQCIDYIERNGFLDENDVYAADTPVDFDLFVFSNMYIYIDIGH